MNDITTAPSATYRLQLHAGFTFDDAARLCDYLSELGVTHQYCSPYLQAARGSTHGYDVIDHTRPNLELGGEEGWRRFVAALRAAQLGQVLDIVPNHMAISSPENWWWADVLENGPSSHFASYFDVEWEPPEARLRNTVLIPILRDHYGRVLEAGELAIVRQGAEFKIRYGDNTYPVSPSSLGPVLGRAARQSGSDLLAFLADAFSGLPRPTATDRASVRRRHRDKAVLREQLRRLLEEDPFAATAVDQVVSEMNSDPDTLHALLETQNYRLAWWRSADRDLGYRRFFDVDTLIGLRMEDEQVFQDTHRRVLEWVREGVLDGLRVDHPDGLRDPLEYFDRLRAAAPETWVVAEKILEPGEQLPREWPIAGTSGYDFLNRVMGLFVDPEGEVPLSEFYQAFTGQTADYPHIIRDKKVQVLREVLGSDVNRLTNLLLQICEQHRRHRDYTRHQLTDALRELIAWFPVYRTYIQPYSGKISESDRRNIETAVCAATKERPDIEETLLEFLRDLLTLAVTGELEKEFVARFQQLTGPAMAKGVEDTAFYTYNRFIALNDVGGDPSRFGTSVAAFHDAAEITQREWPLTMLATDTHDTKRGEDVRARLALLSEQPGPWMDAVHRWSALTQPYRTGEWPDRNTEYFFYQTLVGAWPLCAARATAYMEKVSREAKVHTSWTSPQADYDASLTRFVTGAISDAGFMEDVRQFVERLIEPGRINSLSQTLIKLTSPGVPDMYQGSELWVLNLVDPDNRRAVDYAVRRQALTEVKSMTAPAIWRRADEGLPKMCVTHAALQVRRRQRDAFSAHGGYTPIYAQGPLADHVVAFRRGERVMTIVPRLVMKAAGRWHGTTVPVPRGTWNNAITGEQMHSGDVDLADLWRDFPVALLERVDSRGET
ncbi:MAG TPA: malto-oligosyltrehalose synthase [Vicinamibacterales bacterium]|nr:malto-oligosyltrehalose synthase [Vicinamibacterales bacterium]